MTRYFLVRTVRTVFTLIGATVLVFLIAYVVPGDVADVLVGEYGSPQEVARLRTELGLDKPVVTQYSLYLARLLRGDLGQSAFFQYPVRDMLFEASRVTFFLALGGMLLAVAISVPAGILAAVHRNGAVDYLVVSGSLLALSMPVFLQGLVLLIAFSVYLPWFPSSGLPSPGEGIDKYIKHLVLPWLSIALATAGLLIRFTRAGMLEVLSKQYITVAKAKGLPSSRVLVRHALRNALTPLLTAIGLQFGVLLGGAVLIEILFGLPGLGRVIVRAVGHRDFAVIQGAVLIISTSFVLVNFLVDLLYGLIDPRIRYG